MFSHRNQALGAFFGLFSFFSLGSEAKEVTDSRCLANKHLPNENKSRLSNREETR